MEATDAYQAYISRRREDADKDKFGTLTLSQSDLVAVWNVLADAVERTKTLSAEASARWESILRSIERAAHEAV